MEEERYDQLVVVKLIPGAEENVGDYSMWLDRLVAEIEQQNPQINGRRYCLFKEDRRFDVEKAKVWQARLSEIRGELMKTDKYKKQVEELGKANEEAQAKWKEMQKQLDVSKKYKMSAEKKIRDLHAKANKLPTLEFEFKNLKDKLLRAERSRDIIVEKLKEKQNRELRERNSTENSMRHRNESFANTRDPANSTDKSISYGRTLTKPMAENVEDMEYDFKKKTEMKSLRGLVRHLNKELVIQKSLCLDARLFNFRRRAPNFEKLNRMYNSGVQLSRGPVEALNEPRVSQNPLTNLLDSNVEGANLEVLVEASEEGSLNEGKITSQ